MNAVVDCEKVVGLNNNSVCLGEKEVIATSEEQESVSNLKKIGADFSIPLSIFHYKDYGSDFFTSWYGILSEIFKEINRACPEKKVLNLALSVLMFPYIVFTALGLAVYNKLKTNDKTQISSEENKTEKSEVSESIAKRLAYGVLASIAILVSIPILLLLLIPATPVLAIFYLLNRKLSHSLIDVLKVSSGLYKNEHQNIEVSFRETEAIETDIKWDMEIKFPPQFKQLLRDLYQSENGKWVDVTRDSKHNIILKLSTKIDLKNGLKPLRNEINNVLATSIQEFAKAMEELMKLEKKDITYDKLKELLNEFRLKVISSIDSKLTTHLIENAYQVAFIQAIKFQQDRRGEGFSLENEMKNTLVKQELESQGKELPTEKEVIIRDLKELPLGDDIMKLLDKADDISDDVFLVLKAKWKQFIEEDDIAERTVIGMYKDVYPEETAEALRNAEIMIKELKKMGEGRYGKICQKLKEVYENGKNGSLKDNALKRKLEDLFKLECSDQDIEQKLIQSRIKAIRALLSKSDDKVKQSSTKGFSELEKKEMKTLNQINDFIKDMYLEIKRYKVQSLFEGQEKYMKGLYDLLKEGAPSLVERINVHRAEIAECLEQPISLKKVIEGNKDLNKYLEDEQSREGEEHPNTKLIQKHLKNNQEILKALKQLELEEKGLLINEETENDYREELESREKIKFAIIEDDLLKAFEHEIFDEEAIKTLLEKAELEYYLAEKRIKSPVIKTKDNIKHFSQNLLSPLIDNLVKNIINNVPKNDNSPLLQPVKSFWTCWGYISTGWNAAIRGNTTTEGKALDVAHSTYKEGETFLQHFESSYKKAGAFLGDVFSDDGETFKNDIWPKIRDNLYEVWDRFFRDIEFKVGSRLDEVSLAQPKPETMIVTQ